MVPNAVAGENINIARTSIMEDEGENDKSGDEASDASSIPSPLEIQIPSGESSTIKNWIIFFLMLPLLSVLIATIPDVRRPGWQAWYPISFLLSICWIAVFTFMMVWWCREVGITIGIEDHILGLTVIAAGTSVRYILV